MDVDVVVRLLAGTLFGAAVGAERELTGQPAGLRTHMAVALGAALFGVISTLGFTEFVAVRAASNVQVDPTRVASQVVVGIGFLGSGMILRRGTVVKHLTTAASLWVTCAVGLAAGIGMLTEAAATTGLVLGSLVLLKPFRQWLRLRFGAARQRVRVVVRAGASAAEVLATLRQIDGVRPEHIRYERDDGVDVFVVELRAGRGRDVPANLVKLAERAEVVSLTAA